jgi:ABC-type multidrug transport system ATPase subunit
MRGCGSTVWSWSCPTSRNLNYLCLDRQGPTLSGGEAQRIKLARELAKKGTGRTLFILDEPTTGLHFQDIRMLLGVLQRLVDAGNTVVVIEHNLDVIKTADWVIDLGPEGGRAGGRIVAQGPPEKVARSRNSYTGFFLKELLSTSSKKAVGIKGQSDLRRQVNPAVKRWTQFNKNSKRTTLIILRPWVGAHCSLGPRWRTTPKIIAAAFQRNISAVQRYTPRARGQLDRAKHHCPVAMAQKERVKPHKGQGNPVRCKKVQGIIGIWSSAAA